MKITKYGQSAILLENYKNKRILIDPGSYCYSETGLQPSDFGKIDILLLTHTHNDHCFPSAIKTIKENNLGIIIIGNVEVKDKLASADIASDAMQPGETRQLGEITITTVKQTHGDLSAYGKPTPDNIGFLIDEKIYHPGDAIYTTEKPHAEVLFAPICRIVVMTPEEAARYAREVGAKLVIPIHYDNPRFPVDVNDFVKAAEGLNVRVLGFGESVEWN